MTRLKTLQDLCKDLIARDFPLHSRVHKMQKSPLYIKRDDDLSFGISGSKLRKYASLIPVLRNNRSLKPALVGSAYSNHILSIIQLLKQEGIGYKLFLEKPKTNHPRGNFFFLSLLLSKEDVIFIEKAPDTLTDSWKQNQEQALQEQFFWIPPGGCMKECFFGALTLVLDLLQNEQELNKTFDRIFVDAGTGTTAAALILGLCYLQRQTQVTVVLSAGTEKSFLECLHFFQNILEQTLREKIQIEGGFETVFPVTAKSFGSCNKTILKTIAETAREEGIFLDPIYTSKLYLTAKHLIEKEPPAQNPLWIHSGGSLSITGFQEPLLKRIDGDRFFLNGLFK